MMTMVMEGASIIGLLLWKGVVDGTAVTLSIVEVLLGLSFKHLFDTGNEQALLNATGADDEEFKRLLAVFKPIFDGHLLDERTGLIEKKKNVLNNCNIHRQALLK
jgi:hypothetical protein